MNTRAVRGKVLDPAPSGIPRCFDTAAQMVLGLAQLVGDGYLVDCPGQSTLLGRLGRGNNGHSPTMISNSTNEKAS